MTVDKKTFPKPSLRLARVACIAIWAALVSLPLVSSGEDGTRAFGQSAESAAGGIKHNYYKVDCRIVDRQDQSGDPDFQTEMVVRGDRVPDLSMLDDPLAPLLIGGYDCHVRVLDGKGEWVRLVATIVMSEEATEQESGDDPNATAEQESEPATRTIRSITKVKLGDKVTMPIDGNRDPAKARRVAVFVVTRLKPSEIQPVDFEEEYFAAPIGETPNKDAIRDVLLRRYGNVSKLLPFVRVKDITILNLDAKPLAGPRMPVRDYPLVGRARMKKYRYNCLAEFEWVIQLRSALLFNVEFHYRRSVKLDHDHLIREDAGGE